MGDLRIPCWICGYIDMAELLQEYKGYGCGCEFKKRMPMESEQGDNFLNMSRTNSNLISQCAD